MRTIATHAFPARNGNAPGAIVLSDMGATHAHRYATHWLHGQTGGHGDGQYEDTLDDATRNFDARVAEEMARQAVARPAAPLAGKPFQVELRGSAREEGNDDLHTGDDYASFEDAIRDLRRMQADPRVGAHWEHAYVVGPQGVIHHETRALPRVAEDHDGEASEFATMQGMAHGVSAYNEALGQEVDEEPPSFGMR